MPFPKNTDPTYWALTPEVAEAHTRLFGRRAKVSGIWSSLKRSPLVSPDERAWEDRPRASNVGQDIDLPSESEKTSYKSKGIGPSKKPLMSSGWW
jgi:hypothetical protein